MLQEFLGLGATEEQIWIAHLYILKNILSFVLQFQECFIFWPLDGESKLYGGRDLISDFLGLIEIDFTTASCSPWNGSCIEENLVIMLRMPYVWDIY